MMYVNGEIRSLPEPTSDAGRWVKSVFDRGVHVLILSFVALIAPMLISYCFSDELNTVLVFLISSIFFFVIYKMARSRSQTIAVICFIENPWNPSTSETGVFSLPALLLLAVCHGILAFACALIWDIPSFHFRFFGWCANIGVYLERARLEGEVIVPLNALSKCKHSLNVTLRTKPSQDGFVVFCVMIQSVRWLRSRPIFNKRRIKQW